MLLYPWCSLLLATLGESFSHNESCTTKLTESDGPSMLQSLQRGRSMQITRASEQQNHTRAPCSATRRRMGVINPDDQTDITRSLNLQIEPNDNQAVYTGGKGIIFRNQNDGFHGLDGFVVVPGSFISNDLFMPNPTYAAGQTDTPQVGVILDDMDFLFGANVQEKDYNLGVFYASDANAVDQRCRYEGSDSRYDCRYMVPPLTDNGRGFIDASTGQFTSNNAAIGTAGFDMGNPYEGGGGGGTGCHFEVNGGGEAEINQLNAKDPNGVNLAKNLDCECQTSFVETADCDQFAYSGYNGGKGNCWEKWIQHWMDYGNLAFPVDIKMRDVAGCWMHSMRDMINLQNWFWLWAKYWTTDTDKKTYWGWNEIPIRTSYSNDPTNYVSMAIVLPVDAANLNSMATNYKTAVDTALAWYETNSYLKPGSGNIVNRPGSYITLLRQLENGDGNFDFQFYCESVSLGKYDIVYIPEDAGNPKGACYVEYSR